MGRRGPPRFESVTAGRQAPRRPDQPEVQHGVRDLGPPARLEMGEQLEPPGVEHPVMHPAQRNKPARLRIRGLLRSPAGAEADAVSPGPRRYSCLEGQRMSRWPCWRAPLPQVRNAMANPRTGRRP